MKTSSLALIVLLTVLLLAGIYLLDEEGQSSRDPSAGKRLFRIDREQISQITLVSNETSIQLLRAEEGSWKLDKPVQYPADRQSIGNLLTEIESASSIRTLDLDEVENVDRQMELFGLNREDSMLSIKAEVETFQLIVGEETVRPGQYYARLQHNSRSDVVIIDQTVATLLEHPLAYWRSKRLVQFKPEQIHAIVVREAGEEIRLERNQGQWSISKPFGSPVDPAGLRSYLATISGARVREFVDDQTGGGTSFRLNNPELVVELHESDDKRYILRFGNAKEDNPEQIYASTNFYPVVYTVPAGLKESLGNVIDTTRDKRLIPANTGQDITAIRVQPNPEAQGFSAQRGEGDTWHVDENPELPLDTDAITTFLEALLKTRALNLQMVPNNESESLATFKEGIHAIVSVTCNGLDYRLEFGRRTEDTQMAKTSYHSFLLELDQRVGDLIPDDIYGWYPRQLDLVDDVPNRIEWKRGDKSLVLERDAQGQWVDTEAGNTIEQSFVERQVTLLKSLRAQGRVKMDKAKLNSPDLVLRLQEGEQTRRLEFFLTGEDGRVMGYLVGSDVGFLLHEQDYLTLETFPIPREE
jgi:hypothetical protein